MSWKSELNWVISFGGTGTFVFHNPWDDREALYKCCV